MSDELINISESAAIFAYTCCLSIAIDILHDCIAAFYVLALVGHSFSSEADYFQELIFLWSMSGNGNSDISVWKQCHCLALHRFVLVMCASPYGHSPTSSS
jgi:hypothetical protein